MASELASAGYQVELLDDDAASEVIGGMDLVLAGAEALGPESAINKVGTGDLAAPPVAAVYPSTWLPRPGRCAAALFDGRPTAGPDGCLRGGSARRGHRGDHRAGCALSGEVSGLASRRAVAPELP